MQIAIDTSTDTAGLALVRDNQILAELTWRCGQNHSVQLLPNLAHLLKQNNPSTLRQSSGQVGSGQVLSLESADCIIVARGPGSYNGLRVGISTAKGLAFSLDIPIVGISTLEAEAYQHANIGLPVCPVFNAGREELATAMYHGQGGQWRQIAEEHLTTIEALCTKITTKTVFCGEFVPAIANKLKELLGEKALILSPAANLRRASFLAELGLIRFKAGDVDDAATLQPFYFRGPSISQPKHK